MIAGGESRVRGGLRLEKFRRGLGRRYKTAVLRCGPACSRAWREPLYS